MSLGGLVRKAVSSLGGRRRRHHRDPKSAAAEQAVKEVGKAVRKSGR